MRTYLSERITLWSAVKLATMQASVLFEPCRMICFQPPAQHSLWRRFMAVCGIRGVEQMRLSLGDMVNDRGVNLYWEYDNRMQAAFDRAFASIDMDWLSRVAGQHTDVMRVFLLRAAFADFYNTGRRLMALCGNVQQLRLKDCVLLLPDIPFRTDYGAVFSDGALNLAGYRVPGLVRAVAREIIGAVKSVLQARLMPGQDQAAPPCVAVQFVAGLSTDTVNDIPWFDASGLERQQILIYTNDDRVAEAASAASQAGFRSADFWRWRLPRSLRREHEMAVIRALLASLRILFSFRSGNLAVRLWLAKWVLQFMRRDARLHAFYTAHNVVVHFHAADSNALAIASPVALARRGGLDLAHQLGGNGELVFEFRPLTGRRLLAWSEYHRRLHAELERRVPGKGPQEVNVVGHPLDYLIESRRHAAHAVREKLNSRGVRFIVTALDNVALRDFLVTPDHLRRFYTSLIDLADADSSLGIVVKRKPGNPYRFPADIQERQTRLQESGRWVELAAEASVFEAVTCGDLAIILHMASAGMEAAIANIPHIYYDLTAWGDHAFYKWRASLIATTHEELVQLVDRHRAGTGWGPGNLEFESYRRDLTPHDDGQSARRIGALVRDAFHRRLSSGNQNRS